MPGRPPAARRAVVAHRLGCFCSDQGLGGPSTRAEVIEAFVVAGLAGRASSTRGTYRSVLRSLSERPRPAVATPFPGSGAPPPYRAAERAELFNIASAQRSPWRRSGALALVALGTGAGLRAGELVALRGHDVTLGPGMVTVKVGGDRARSIVVGGLYGQTISALAAGAGDGHVFCPGPAKRSYHNFVNNFARTLVTGPGAPELSSGRCRSSFICDHLAAGTPLRELLHVAGIAQVESLLRYARHVPGAPRSKAELRARVRAQ